MATNRKAPTMSERKRRAISAKGQESQVTTRAPSNFDRPISESSGGGAIPGGPEDSSVLTSFESHIAYDIWNNPDARKPLKCIHHFQKLKEWNISKECEGVRERVKASDLMNLAEFTYKFIDKTLVSAFVERWHPETNTSHLPFGEMTITLDDVCQILGVPVIGTCVHEGGKKFSSVVGVTLLETYLGVSTDEAMKETNTCSVRLEWLKTMFKGTPQESESSRLDQCARAYLLYLLGCTIFADKTGNRVSISYLECLKDLDDIRGYAWGMAILAYLFRQLGKASRADAVQIVGYFTLLQAWVYEHFNVGTPLYNQKYDEKWPRMCKWLSKVTAGDGNAGVVLLHAQLDALNEKEVCWDPYHAHRGDHPLQEFAYYNGLLVCFNVAEPYYPDRVLRQFGHVQAVPKKTMKPSNSVRGKKQGQYKVKYNVDNWIQESWENHLLASKSRTEPVKDPWDARANYMGWFTKISHVQVQNPKNAIEHVWKAKVVEMGGPIEDKVAEGRRAFGLLKKIDFDGEMQANKMLLKDAIEIFDPIYGKGKAMVEEEDDRNEEQINQEGSGDGHNGKESNQEGSENECKRQRQVKMKVKKKPQRQQVKFQHNQVSPHGLHKARGIKAVSQHKARNDDANNWFFYLVKTMGIFFW